MYDLVSGDLPLTLLVRRNEGSPTSFGDNEKRDTRRKVVNRGLCPRQNPSYTVSSHSSKVLKTDFLPFLPESPVLPRRF